MLDAKEHWRSPAPKKGGWTTKNLALKTSLTLEKVYSAALNPCVFPSILIRWPWALRGPSEDYTFCGVDLKPVLPVAWSPYLLSSRRVWQLMVDAAMTRWLEALAVSTAQRSECDAHYSHRSLCILQSSLIFKRRYMQLEVIGGLCMLLVQIPMLSRFTFLDQATL